MTKRSAKSLHYSSFLIGFPARCCLAGLFYAPTEKKLGYFSSFFWENVVKMFN